MSERRSTPDQPSERLLDLRRQRREKADALRAAGIDPYPARGGGPLTRIAEARARFETAEARAGHGRRAAVAGGGPDHESAAPGQAGVPGPARRIGHDPDHVPPQPTGRRLAAARVLRPGRLHRGGRRADPHADGRGVGRRVGAATADQVAAAAAGEVPRLAGRGGALPAALPRLAGERRLARGAGAALADRGGGAALHGVAGVLGGGDAGAPIRRGRGGGAALRDAPERARRGALPAHRAGVASQASHRGRARPRLRAGAHLPQRGHIDAPQPRVHDAGVVRGLRRLPGRGADGGGSRRDGGRRRCWARHRCSTARSGWSSRPPGGG